LKILVTGAKGFVGRNLVEYLNSYDGNSVYGLSRNLINLNDYKSVKRFFSEHTFDVIIHTASSGGSRKDNYDAAAADVTKRNLDMFFHLENCLKPGMKMIHLGSGAEYDKSLPCEDVREEDFGRSIPQDAYGFSKYAISKYIEATQKQVICLRIFGLYGRYENYTFKFISNAILKNILGMPITINQNVVFSFLYIKDLLKIVHHFLNHHPEHKCYNLTPLENVDLQTIAATINTISPHQREIITINPGFNTPYTGSCTRLLKEIPGFIFTDIKAGIKELYGYYAANYQSLDLETVKDDPYLKLCKVGKEK
jgi:GDP-L-fucose synthase